MLNLAVLSSIWSGLRQMCPDIQHDLPHHLFGGSSVQTPASLFAWLSGYSTSEPPETQNVISVLLLSKTAGERKKRRSCCALLFMAFLLFSLVLLMFWLATRKAQSIYCARHRPLVSAITSKAGTLQLLQKLQGKA